MKLLKIFVIYLIVNSLSIAVLNAGNNGILQQDKEGLVYKKARSYGAMLHGNGLGISADFINLKNYYKRKFYRVELVTMKHPKEFKETAFLNRSRPYAYGKINSFYNLQASRGVINLLADKGRKNGVEISWLYAYGVALGIAKPYYLLDCNEETHCPNPTPIKYSEDPEIVSKFLSQDNQLSKASGGLGWTEVKLHPGLHAKIGVNIDFALFDDIIQAVEFGVMVNAYAKRIPILIGDNNRFIFPNVYIKASLGKRIY